MKWLIKKLSFFCLLALANLSHAEILLHPLAGKPISFNSLKGKWIFINYWASWCQPCLDEIKELNRFYESKKDDVALFAVNYDKQSLPILNGLIRKYKITYPSLRIDPASDLNLGDIQGVPATFVFNKEGKLVNILYGAQNLKSLNNALIKYRSRTAVGSRSNEQI
ncbi:MAG: TlpA family protein disulfide reductase [Proteobacteria bacterium]|nr:TlpA family protein disulfide reductase [Pseudomonadota bacterium]